MIKLLKCLEKGIGYINKIFGLIASLAIIFLIFTSFFSAISRELLLFTHAKIDDTITILFAATFTLSTGYALMHHSHVRIDIFYEKTTAKCQALINILGSLFLGLPCMYFLLSRAWPKAQNAFNLQLTSQYSNGLSFYWILKYFIVLSALLFILQIFSLIIHSFLILLGESKHNNSFKKPIVENVTKE